MRVFLDTNILLDTLVERPDPKFGDNAATILALGENGTVKLFMSVLSIPTIAYVLKNMTAARKKAVISDILSVVELLPSLPQHVVEMLDGTMKDIEDSLQVQSAKEGQCDLIVTRNLADFRGSDIPAISPDDFLRRILG